MTKSVGGCHSDTATLTNALAREGVSNPNTGKPFTEAMMLGIGGGLGAGYILWEFKSRETANIVMGFRNRWNYTVEFLIHACNRLNIKVDERETGSKNKAQSNLDDALAQGKAVIVWVDKARLPYHNLPEEMKAHLVHVIGVFGKDGDKYQIDDLASKSWTLTSDDLATAREPIPSNKQRTMTFNPSYEFDLKSAVMGGIQDHIEHLSRDSESFSLPVYQKWAKMMTHPKNKKSWQIVFKERAGLYTTLRTIHEGITLDDTAGAGLRTLYADFLTEADAVMDADLGDAIQAYRQCAETWRDFANIVMSDEVPEFAKTKKLMQTRYQAFKAGDTSKLAKTMDDLSAMEQQYNKEGFPLDDKGVTALFEEMEGGLNTIYDAEQTALNTLKDAIE